MSVKKALDRLFIPLSIKVVPITEYCLKFDGCSKGNPGPSGAGAVIYRNDSEVWSRSIYVGDKETNNVAEYSGLILGLNKASELGIREMLVIGDSELIIKQMKGEYKVKSLNIMDFYLRAKRLATLFDEIQYQHVYRKDNVRADELANIGLEIKVNP